jgi:hypothetical protein
MTWLDKVEEFCKSEPVPILAGDGLRRMTTAQRLLVEVGKKARRIHNVYDPGWEFEYRRTKKPTVYEWEKIQERARDDMELALFAALDDPDCRELLEVDDES